MLSVYTRHHPDCKNAGDKTWRRCSCPKWIWGSLNGKFIRQSAKTPRWEEAEELRRQLSEGLLPASRPAAKTDLAADPPVPRREGSSSDRPQKPRVTVEAAVKAYLADATSRGVAPATHTKLTTIFRKQFLSWTQSQGLAYLDEIDLDALLNFRSAWADAALAKQKKQSRLIGFFWACVRRRYLQENPALGLGKIKVVQIPTDYFPQEEFDRIIDATYHVCDNRGGFIDTDSNRTRLRTMTLLMRWSGLRIRDAITLERHRLGGDSLLLYQAKTGTPVYVPLPPFVVEALENLPAGPKPNPRYFFWSGNGDRLSIARCGQQFAERQIMPVARTENDRDNARVTPLVPFYSTRHLALIAVVGSNKIRAHQKQNHLRGIEVGIDCIAYLTARRDPAIMPSRDQILALQRRQVNFQLISKRFIDVRIGKEKGWRHFFFRLQG
ncbi:MAG: hypothetical protein WAV06_16325 [Terracidiphilus sp.]